MAKESPPILDYAAPAPAGKWPSVNAFTALSVLLPGIMRLAFAVLAPDGPESPQWDDLYGVTAAIVLKLVVYGGAAMAGGALGFLGLLRHKRRKEWTGLAIAVVGVAMNAWLLLRLLLAIHGLYHTSVRWVW